MTESAQPPLDERQELFRAAMIGAEAERLRMRRFFAMLPSNPRCKATGPAFVGAVGERGEIEDFTALGDAVNTTARLASVAPAGEALISTAAAAEASLDTTGLERRHLEVKGRTQPVDIVVLRAG